MHILEINTKGFRRSGESCLGEGYMYGLLFDIFATFLEAWIVFKLKMFFKKRYMKVYSGSSIIFWNSYRVPSVPPHTILSSWAQTSLPLYIPLLLEVSFFSWLQRNNWGTVYIVPLCLPLLTSSPVTICVQLARESDDATSHRPCPVISDFNSFDMPRVVYSK